MKERFAGCLLGLALGDALGAPFEGMPQADYPLSCDRDLTFTDDTEMMINLTESILETGDVEPASVATHVASGMDERRGYGPGTRRVLSLIRAGIPYGRAATMVFREGSCGNGAAMRIAPVGLLYWWDRRRLAEAVVKASIPTHVHPIGIEGALAIASTVGLVLRGADGDHIVDQLLACLHEEELRRKILVARELLGEDVTGDEIVVRLGNGVLTQESVPTALYAFLKFGADFERLMRYCVSLGGDTDTISAMAGALSGASVTERALPAPCVRTLEGAERIRALAERLFVLSEELMERSS